MTGTTAAIHQGPAALVTKVDLRAEIVTAKPQIILAVITVGAAVAGVGIATFRFLLAGTGQITG